MVVFGAFEDAAPGWQAVAVLGLPAVLVWWVERRIARRRKGRSEPGAGDQDAASTSRPAQAARGPGTPYRMGPMDVGPEPEATTPFLGDGPSADVAGWSGWPLADPDSSPSPAEPRDEEGPAEPPVRGATTDRSFPRSRTGWVGPGESAVVAGRRIGGMVYVGVAPTVAGRGRRERSRAHIDPSLPVARRPQGAPREQMPYWPGYSEVGPVHRAVYLDWLTDGRQDAGLDPGYMFLFFYGLERRIFTEEPPPEERRAILDEVLRLRTLYPGSGSVQRYLGAFADVARVEMGLFPEDPPSIDPGTWEVPLPLKAALGARIGRGEPLAASWLLAWFLSHPERSLRTPATRCEAEFAATFHALFDIRFPEGLKVTRPRKTLAVEYQAASSEFAVTVTPKVDGDPVPDVSGLRRPIEIAQEIADEAMEALDGYSRLMGKEPEAAGTLRGHLMLPAEIRASFPSRERAELEDWTRGRMASGGLVPVLDVIERVAGRRPAKLAKRDLVEAADLLARLGIGLAPDPRFALRRPKADEPVVLFDLGGEVEALEEVSPAFSAALLDLALRAFMAHADGTVDDAERTALTAFVSEAELPGEVERRRLAANLAWFLNVPPDMTLLRQRLKNAPAEGTDALRTALVAAAHADDVVTPEEVASMEKAYRALGLDPGLVFSDLHAGGAAEGPVSVRSAQAAAPGEAIPAEARATSGGLDPARIAAIRSDTSRVSSILGGIFDEEPEVGPDAAPAPVGALAGLDDAHGRLVRKLVTREHWDSDAFEALCRDEGLMASGALETINEWAFEAHEEALLDEHDGYDVAPELAARLRQETEEMVA